MLYTTYAVYLGFLYCGDWETACKLWPYNHLFVFSARKCRKKCTPMCVFVNHYLFEHIPSPISFVPFWVPVGEDSLWFNTNQNCSIFFIKTCLRYFHLLSSRHVMYIYVHNNAKDTLGCMSVFMLSFFASVSSLFSGVIAQFLCKWFDTRFFYYNCLFSNCWK